LQPEPEPNIENDRISGKPEPELDIQCIPSTGKGHSWFEALKVNTGLAAINGSLLLALSINWFIVLRHHEQRDSSMF